MVLILSFLVCTASLGISEGSFFDYELLWTPRFGVRQDTQVNRKWKIQSNKQTLNVIEWIYIERIRDNISASKSGGNRAVKTQDKLETSVDKHHTLLSPL